MVTAFGLSLLLATSTILLPLPAHAGGGQGGNNQNGQQGDNNQGQQGGEGGQQANQQDQNAAANAPAAGAQAQSYGGQQSAGGEGESKGSEQTPPEAPKIKTPSVKGVDMSSLIQPIAEVAIDEQAAMAYVGGAGRGSNGSSASTVLAIGNDSVRSPESSINFLNITSNNRATFTPQATVTPSGFVDFETGLDRAASNARGRLFGNLETGDPRQGYSMGIVEGSTSSRKFKSAEPSPSQRKPESAVQSVETPQVVSGSVTSLATGGHRPR